MTTASTPYQRLGKYELHEQLGEGAMGTVWKAYDTVLRRFVALKLMTSSVGKTPDLRERFFREAHSAGNLQHPNIVTIYDLGEADAQLFIAMELLAGKDLSDVILGQEPLPLERKLDILIEMLDALHYAHGQGVIHRDVKPANVRFTADGRVKLLDFGIARLQSSELTRSGALVGTPTYMAPELVTNGPVTPSTDVFAAGCLLYELLAYQKPFMAETLQGVLYQVLTTDPPPLRTVAPSIPAALERVAARAMAKAPQDRFQAAAEMRQALLAIRAALSAGADASTELLGGGWAPVPRPFLRLLRTAPLKWSVGVVGIMVAVAAWIVWQAQSPYEPEGGRSPSAAAGPAGASEEPPAAPALSVGQISPTVVALRESALVARQRAVNKGAVKNDVAAISSGMGAFTSADRAVEQGAEARAAPLYREALETFRRAGREVDQLRRQAERALATARPGVRALGASREGTAATAQLARAESLYRAMDYNNAIVFAKAAENAALALGVAPPRAQPRDPRDAVGVLLGDLARAVASERVFNIRALYPRISDAEARGWEDFFRSANNLQAGFRIRRFSVQGSRATAQVEGRYHYAAARGGAPREVRPNYDMTFTKMAAGWRIASVKERR